MRLPPAEIKNRRAAFFDRLYRLGPRAAWISRPEDVRYLTGFTGGDAWLLLAWRAAWLVTDFRFIEEAERAAQEVEIVEWSASPERTAAGLLRKRGVRKVGYNARHLSVHRFGQLRRACRGAAFTPIDAALDEIRSVKSAWEIARMARAQRVAEAAFRAWKPSVAAGASERDLAAELEWRLRQAGAEGPSFPAIVASGANASLPHAIPGGAKAAAGKPLIVDFGARVEGYASDTTRTLFLGDPGRRWRERYALVLAAQEAALARLGPASGGMEASRAAALIFREAGVAELFGHSLGHGVGLAVHEPPRLAGWRAALEYNTGQTDAPAKGGTRAAPDASADSMLLLKPGQVVTVEPGLYWPGSGGVRIEDMAVIASKGCRNLTRLPKGLEEVIL